MFALKSLHIPLPGRHPASPCLSYNLRPHEYPNHLSFLYATEDIMQSSFQQTSPRSDLIDSFPSLESPQQKVSPAMSSLQGNYGPKSTTDPKISQGSEKDVYREGFSHYLYLENVQYLRPLPASNTPFSHHRKSRSLVNGFLDENNGLAYNQLTSEVRESKWKKWNKNVVRWHSSLPKMLMGEDSSVGVSSAITGKRLALRSKAASRTVSPFDLKQVV
ncbi:hypothetical protein GH714_019876 [Hevea brasiliensis]|uniref:Uncharacterized protein n=1 Tax=Hevea brasiliensis TaxID=3981 RepID=A0A6A6NAG9_HEVBR|nr:hypothetical protein GH714_019876 [Hevea brasiliensis]